MSQHMVYLDCDGVFADFVTGILAKMDYPFPGWDAWPFGHIFDIFPLLGTNWAEASKFCTTDFWANLPWMSDGQRLRDEVWKRFRPDETIMLTKPMDHDDSYTGKARWVTKHMPELRRRFVPTHINKHEFAYDFNCLLIDDSEKNYDAFVGAGGAGILVPRPNNANDKIYFAGEAVSYVAERMDKWIELVKHPASVRNRKE